MIGLAVMGRLLSAVATASALQSAPPAPRAFLRGDFDVPSEVLVGLSPNYPTTLAPLLEGLARGGARVHAIVPIGTSRAKVRRWLDTLGPIGRDVRLLDIASDSPWVRDYGPLQLRREGGESKWLDPLYPERSRDDRVPRWLGQAWSIPVEALPWSLDGGALASNGAGLCVSTTEYFAAHGIPGGGSSATRVAESIGCSVLVMVRALPDEPTHHADLFVQFLGPHEVAIARLDPRTDPVAARRLDEAVVAIRGAGRDAGLELDVVRPPIGLDLDGSYHAYLNGIRLDGVFLMPVYAPEPLPAERAARETLEAAMPGVEVVRIPAWEMIDLGGALHCVVLGVFR